MPNESENQSKMHEPLQAYAHKRRQDAAAPGGMHPATKRLLLAEVRKQFGTEPGEKTATKPGWGWLPAAWPRWAFALAACSAIVVGMVVVFFPGQPTSQQMAKNEALADNRDAEAMIAPPPPPAAQAPSAETPVLLQRAESTPPLQPASADSLAAASPRQLSESKQDAAKLALKDEGPSFREARTAPALSAAQPVPAAPPAPVAPAPALPPPATLPVTVAGANTGATREEAPVLANFEFQQTGETVRVIDADGSVYDGRFLTNAPAASVSATFAASDAVEQKAKGEQAPTRRSLTTRNDLAREKQAAQSRAAVTNALNSYSFQVRGTNLRSQQSVELDGVFVPNAAPAGTQLGGQSQLAAPNQAEATKPGQEPGQGQYQNRARFYRAMPQNAPAPTAQAAAAAQRPGEPATNAQMLQRIQGVLRVGGGNAQPLDAWQSQSEK